jgi:hypothetical protein
VTHRPAEPALKGSTPARGEGEEGALGAAPGFGAMGPDELRPGHPGDQPVDDGARHTVNAPDRPVDVEQPCERESWVGALAVNSRMRYSGRDSSVVGGDAGVALAPGKAPQ